MFDQFKLHIVLLFYFLRSGSSQKFVLVKPEKVLQYIQNIDKFRNIVFILIIRITTKKIESFLTDLVI